MSSPAPPWEAWKLDEEFLGALVRWTITNGDNALDRILERICSAIDNSEKIIEVIPDSPFPARSLVKALGQLIKLGTVHCYINLCHKWTKLSFMYVGYVEGQERRERLCKGSHAMDRPSGGCIS